MFLFLFALIPVAFAGGYASPPNIAPALAAYGSNYGNQYPTPYGGNQYSQGYPSGPSSYSPFGINGVYGGSNSYNTGFQPHPFVMYSNAPNYGGYPGNNYPSGFTNSYNTGNAYTVGPIYTPSYTQGPNYNTGVTAIPSPGPIGIAPIGLTGSTYGGATPFGSGVTPAGVLPNAFNNDPWAGIAGQPLLRGVSTKKLNKEIKEKELSEEETKKKARA